MAEKLSGVYAQNPIAAIPDGSIIYVVKPPFGTSASQSAILKENLFAQINTELTDANNNTAVGGSTGSTELSTLGHFNTGLGSTNLNATGVVALEKNGAIGAYNLRSLINGTGNWAASVNALSSLTAGNYNSVWGGIEGFLNLETGSRNSAISTSDSTGVTYNGAQSSNLIWGGHQGLVGDNGVTRIGWTDGSASQTAFYADGIYSVASSGLTAPRLVYMGSDGRFGVSSATLFGTLTGNTGGTISPTSGNINVVGTGTIAVAGSGSTLTISSTATPVNTITGNSGGAISPSAGNINIVGGTGIAVVGSGSTLTLTASGAATNAPPNYITGGQFSWAVGSPTQVSMAPVICMDSTNTYQITTVAPIVFTSSNLDTGSWSLGARYYAFICDNPTTPSPIIVVSLSPTTPDLTGHSGYTKFRYVGYVQSDSRGTAIDGFIQEGNSTQRTVTYVSADSTKFPVITAGASATAALVACAGCIGANSTRAKIAYQGSVGGMVLTIYTSLDTSIVVGSFSGGSAGIFPRGVFEVPLDSSQQFYYSVSGAGNVNMQVVGFTENL